MSFFSPKASGSFSADMDSAQPDFENNLAQFEAEFNKFVAETDPNFDFNLLRYKVNPFANEIPAPISEVMHPNRKAELPQNITLSGPKTVNSSIFAERVILEGDIQVKGNIYGLKGVLIGPNCRIEGSVVSGGSLQIDNGSRVEGTIVGEEVIISGKVQVEGPAISRGDFAVQGTLEAQDLVAVRNISLLGNENDYVKLEASTLFAQTGEIEVKVPVKLGHSSREADLDAQRFYLTRATDGTFRLARAPSPYHDGVRPAQGTIITNLSDAELEKLLAEFTALER